MEAPEEELAYVALINADRVKPDALAVVDTRRSSKTYGRQVGQVDMPNVGDELHHFGWNACSSHLCAYAPHAHVERRYLVLPGTQSSNIHIVDTKPDPRNPAVIRTIDAETVAKRTGYANLHTAHCGPDGIYVNALGAPSGDGPGGIFVMDHETFDIRGRWESTAGRSISRTTSGGISDMTR
jgi:selenium-binding protein 1